MSANAFKDYLISIGNYPVLTAEEEQQLARTMRDTSKPDSVRERARQRLIECNLKLVVVIAKNYKNSHLSIADLVEEGNLGLMTAVEKFNPDLNYRFSTCATPWIKQQITKAITDKGRNIRIPAHIYQMLRDYRKAVDDLTTDYHAPSDLEIADRMGVSVDKVNALKAWRQDTISLNTPLGDESDDTLEDLQADTNDETPVEYADRQATRDRILSVIHTFKPRTQTIIKMRYGLGEEGDPAEFFTEHTLEEIGAYLQLTRERVRQIEKETLSRIKLLLGDFER